MQTRVVLLVCILLAVASGIALVQEQVFKDVPETHWAAEAVQYLAENKIIQGYPDGKFRGDQPVTRYELAVLLLRFTEFINETLQIPKDGATCSASSSGEMKSKPSPGKGLNAFAKDEPARILIKRGFLPEDSALLKDADRRVSETELADTFAWVLKRIVELKVPVAEDKPESEDHKQLSTAKTGTN